MNNNLEDLILRATGAQSTFPLGVIQRLWSGYGVIARYGLTGCEYGSVIVKVRDGRPIKIEGNTLSSISQGGTTARIQASVLNLYDDARFKGPLKGGQEITWEKSA